MSAGGLDLRRDRARRLANLWLRLAPLAVGGCYLGRGSSIGAATRIGRGTRVNGATLVRGAGTLEIGNYCAIAFGSGFATSNHGVGGANLQYALQRRLGLSAPLGGRRDIRMGHNVWLGDRVMVLPGVEIGNGAVVGAGSVVTRDVGAFEIHAGVPARRVRARFPDVVAERLQALAWWEWSDERLRRSVDLFSRDLAAMDTAQALEFLARFDGS